ncbi:hypothetical protein INS49_004528 [Diaporthe citri]|uniref:uncharacterized protein n=1 Tax=Diaporthe citri TaxID=83186 RepID=UPI001C812C2A|nr:uncharacterized protein INS49_004528 [Diaporthe citri]KAG6354511.1 hypothetical protein INS49_004528 [Diaporthe citri]
MISRIFQHVLAKDTKLDFPLEPGHEQNLARLVNEADPATFGLHGKDVLDESFRKASKLDPSQFSTSFNPYELGIIDTVAQALLPSTKAADSYRAVRAELYKLNIYSGPSGKFKAHLDTPRSNTQFGSLVVCLPVQHEGGKLVARHKGKEMAFDWGNSTQSIQFAAFYSDVEHEVLEVHSGHRVTLTYNLYAVRGNGLLTGHCPTLDAKQLPLYQSACEMLGCQKFMSEGGYLGFFCAHAYAHTNTQTTKFPDMLKGIDMAIWETFTALGLETMVRPVIDFENNVNYYDFDDDESEDSEPSDNKLVPAEKRIIGSALSDMYYGGSTEWDDDVLEGFADEVLGNVPVHWLTDPGNEELQVNFIAVIGGGIVGSVGALIFQRRWRASKAKKTNYTNSLVVMERMSDDDQGANKLLHTWVCI